MTTEKKAAPVAKPPEPPSHFGENVARKGKDIAPGHIIWRLVTVKEVHQLGGGKLRLMLDDGTEQLVDETSTVASPPPA